MLGKCVILVAEKELIAFISTSEILNEITLYVYILKKVLHTAQSQQLSVHRVHGKQVRFSQALGRASRFLSSSYFFNCFFLLLCSAMEGTCAGSVFRLPIL